MRAWNGGAYDTRRDRLVIWGGGHGDYGGNEVYVFDVRRLRWERLTEPSATTRCSGRLNEEAGQTEYRINGDGTPVAHHTYDGIEYVPSVDKLFVKGTSIWPIGGKNSYTWFFDFNRLSWTRKAELPDPNPAIAVSAYDPFTGNVYYHNVTSLFEYDPLADTWHRRGVFRGWLAPGRTGELDPIDRKFYIVGSGAVWYYDLKEEGVLKPKRLPTAGDRKIEDVFAPGLAYDIASGRLVAWAGTTKRRGGAKGWIPADIGDTVYALDPRTGVWTKHPPAGPVAPPKRAAVYNHGTYGRWRYIPSKDVFIGVNSVHGNVYFYRLPYR